MSNKPTLTQATSSLEDDARRVARNSQEVLKNAERLVHEANRFATLKAERLRLLQELQEVLAVSPKVQQFLEQQGANTISELDEEGTHGLLLLLEQEIRTLGLCS